MTYEKMKAVLQDYNWDNGFDVPKQILLVRIAIWLWH